MRVELDRIEPGKNLQVRHPPCKILQKTIVCAQSYQSLPDRPLVLPLRKIYQAYRLHLKPIVGLSRSEQNSFPFKEYSQK